MYVFASVERDVHVPHIGSLVLPWTEVETLIDAARDVWVWIADAAGADVELGDALVIQVNRVDVVTWGLGANGMPCFLGQVGLEGDFVQDIAGQTCLILKRPATAENEGIRWEEGCVDVCKGAGWVFTCKNDFVERMSKMNCGIRSIVDLQIGPVACYRSKNKSRPPNLEISSWSVSTCPQRHPSLV